MDAGYYFTTINADFAIFYADFSASRVVRFFPPCKVFAVEEWLPLGGAAGGGEGDGDKWDELFHG